MISNFLVALAVLSLACVCVWEGRAVARFASLADEFMSRPSLLWLFLFLDTFVGIQCYHSTFI